MAGGTIIIGSGIIGCATAYYLSASGDTDPASIHLVEASPELFASASGKAAGFLAADCKPLFPCYGSLLNHRQGLVQVQHLLELYRSASTKSLRNNNKVQSNGATHEAQARVSHSPTTRLAQEVRIGSELVVVEHKLLKITASNDQLMGRLGYASRIAKLLTQLAASTLSVKCMIRP